MAANSWKVGDTLCITGSGTGRKEHEFVTIAGINGTSITLSETLSYLHYGAASALDTNLRTVDMRSSVAHITRNIRFTCNEVDNWGGRILVTKFFDYANFI